MRILCRFVLNQTTICSVLGPRFPPHGHIVSTGPGGILYETNTIAADDYQRDRIVILT